MKTAQIYYQYPSINEYLLGKESRTILSSMDNDDQIMHVARQRRVSGAVISPSVIIVSLKRIIIVNRWVGGVRSEMSFIPYQNIVSIRVSHGAISSSLYVRVKGSSKEKAIIFGNDKEEGEINGLNRAEAEAIFMNVNKTLREYEESFSEGKQFHVHGDFTNNNIYVDRNMAHHTWPQSNNAGEMPITQSDEGPHSYMLENDSSHIKCLTHTGMQSYASAGTTNVTVNNGEIAHNIKADDLLIFKMRKPPQIRPEDLKIFKARSSRFGFLR